MLYTQAFKQVSRWKGGNGIGLFHMKELAGCLGGSVGYKVTDIYLATALTHTISLVAMI